MQYFNNLDLFNYLRRKTSVVTIGDTPMGGNYPIRLQSMTNTPTLDTKATVEQCKRIIDAGADYVRITTPAVRDAENLVEIKKQLRQAGYHNPLVADVHFNPKVAEVAARIVEKVRINPGNYIDKKSFEHIDYTDTEYLAEIERIHERISPLLDICKEHGTAIRIGVNHGSLSDRIMSRYGDTPEGMAESAMEFLRIFETKGFRNTVISMKSSNTRVMVQSTRLLVEKMANEGMQYPVHLGVTEAGEGEDGIIKSAVGIGSLLADGIGETIRVSLTGSPEQEIPVARTIVDYFVNRRGHSPITSDFGISFNPFEYQKRKSVDIERIGGSQTPKVVVSVKSEEEQKMVSTEDYVYSKDSSTNLFKYNTITALSPECQVDAPRVLVIDSAHPHITGEVRAILARLQQYQSAQPLVVRRRYAETDKETFQIKAACDFGPLFTDGFLDGIWIENDNLSSKEIYQVALNILQASRLRMSKTEYISCPSCGRTLFDLSATTAKIRERTSHLKHLKIGIMGCIVNGPGEMADADFGYVGTGPGKITLYKSKEVVKRNIPEENAVDELINLIKESGQWIDL
ncbi:MAG: (E)-4-hydroxy-3-methylbut-2-enyl-diphosphate synthase [Bacteroidota bacterium]|nr:(E)-4-hydroxy-3-methylbut-2-enyl-diphosphate synthase [Bacteroidota bacterium]